jgi:hypothetical protein
VKNVKKIRKSENVNEKIKEKIKEKMKQKAHAISF